MLQVRSVACGAEHTVILADSGIYSWGNNEHGQLGTGDTKSHNRPQQQPLEVASGELDTVVCGHFHTLVYGNDIVYGWGDNSFGQLSLPKLQKVKSPTRLGELERRHACDIAAGAFHTAFLSPQARRVLC